MNTPSSGEQQIEYGNLSKDTAVACHAGAIGLVDALDADVALANDA